MATQAAMRAAKAIMENWQVGDYGEDYSKDAEQTKVAEVIDEVTGLPELVKVLRNDEIPNNGYGTLADSLGHLARMLRDGRPAIDPSWGRWLKTKAVNVRAALAKAEPTP